MIDSGHVLKFSLSTSVFAHNEGAEEDYVVLKHKSATIISVSVALEMITQQW